MRPRIIWFFGLPSAGKTTLATALRDELVASGQTTALLDGDILRGGLCRDLSFTDEDRTENIRRAAEIAKLLAAQGQTVVCAFITPQEHHRELVREVLGSSCLLVHVACPLKVCIARDVKGLYRQTAVNHTIGMTGTQVPFVPPTICDLVVNTSADSVAQSLRQVMRFVAGLPRGTEA